MSNKNHPRLGRKKKELSVQEINKANLMWHLNSLKLSDIARSLGHSPSVIERNIFPTRAMYEDWHSANFSN